MALKLQTYVLDTALKTIQEKAKTVRDQAVLIKSQIDAGPVQSDIVVNLMRNLKVAYDVIDAAKAAPGLNVYARNEFNDQTLDYVAEVDAALAAMLTCYSWVNTNFPKDANGYLLKDKIVNGAIDNRVFAQAQTAGLSTALGTLIAAFA
jgi:hypothetical protein